MKNILPVILFFLPVIFLAQHVQEVPDIVKQHFIEKHTKAVDIQWEVDELTTTTGHEDIFVVEYTEEDVDFVKVYAINETLLETRTKINPVNLQSDVKDSLEVHYSGLTIYTVDKIEKQKEKPFYQMMMKYKEGNYFLKVNLKGIILFERKD